MRRHEERVYAFWRLFALRFHGKPALSVRGAYYFPNSGNEAGYSLQTRGNTCACP